MSDDKQHAAPSGRNDKAVPVLNDWDNMPEQKPSLRERFSDAVTAGMGSWKFVMGQSVILAAWITLNTTNVLPIPHWDPNLILLNLALSTEAAFAGAFILMSQNRQGEKDRRTVQQDYHVDLNTERTMIEMSRKLDALLAVIPPEQLKAMMVSKEAAAPAQKVSNDNAAAPAAKRPAKPGLG
jgi:uncharacterized membrane protein